MQGKRLGRLHHTRSRTQQSRHSTSCICSQQGRPGLGHNHMYHRAVRLYVSALPVSSPVCQLKWLLLCNLT